MSGKEYKTHTPNSSVVLEVDTAFTPYGVFFSTIDCEAVVNTVMYTESREDLESIIEQLQEFLDRPEKCKIPDYVSFLELSGVYYSRVEDYWLDEKGVSWDTGQLEDKITALDDKNELRYIG